MGPMDRFQFRATRMLLIKKNDKIIFTVHVCVQVQYYSTFLLWHERFTNRTQSLYVYDSIQLSHASTWRVCFVCARSTHYSTVVITLKLALIFIECVSIVARPFRVNNFYPPKMYEHGAFIFHFSSNYFQFLTFFFKWFLLLYCAHIYTVLIQF